MTRTILIGLLLLSANLTAQTQFKILSLGASGSTISSDHTSLTGDKNGAIALSSARLFYTGDGNTARFDLNSLAGTTLSGRYITLLSDLQSGKVYTLARSTGGNNTVPISGANHTASVLREVNGISGALDATIITLSTPIAFSGASDNVAFFSGFGRAVVVITRSANTTVYDIALPSGTVTTATLPSGLTRNPCESTWAGSNFGVAEYFGGSLYLAYVNGNTVQRRRVPDGQVETIQGFTNLAGMCSFAVAPSTNRWYFQHEGQSQFGGAGTDSEHVGYAGATFNTFTDNAAPVTTLSLATLPDGTNDWYKSNVNVQVGAADNVGGSGIKETQCSINSGAYTTVAGGTVTLTNDGIHNLSCRSTDNANNTESPDKTLTVKIDKTLPGITFVARTPANGAGWNNTNVVIDWSCSDTTSGPLTATVSKTLSSEGAALSDTGVCADQAGNTASNTQSGIKIDKTAPVIVFGAVTPAANANGWHNSNVSVAYTLVDPLSGVAGNTTGAVSITGQGTELTGSVTVTDNAGNSTTYTTAALKIDSIAPGITVQSKTAANVSGWNKENVEVVWACTDANPTSATVTQTVSAQGANQSTTGTCTDLAGNSASNTVNGINIDKTAPQITLQTSFAPGTWRNTDLTLTWGCSDALSGPVDAAVSQEVTTEGANQSASGTCADQAGNTASNTVTGINIDKTAPGVTVQSRTAPNAAGWNNGNVQVVWACSDANPTSPTVTQTLSTEGANQSTQGTCTDLAGNSTSNTVSGINIDTTAPQIALQTAFTTAWRNTDLTLTWGCSDALSTPVASTVSQTASAEGANQSLTGTCSDKAGNTATNTANGINIDKTAPAITLTAPASASSYYVGQLVNAAYGCTDAASGVTSAGCIGTVANGSAINTTGVGTTKTFIVNAADMAGNTATISRTYSISAIPSTVSGGLSAGSVQFSDKVTLTALVGAIANTGGVLSGGVTLRIGSQVVATGLPIAAAAAGIPVAMLNPNLPAGTYAVTAEFVSTNPNYAGASNLLGNLTVTREDTPTIRYTGDTLMFTTGNSASVSVRATVEQPQDGSLVDFNALNTGTPRLVVDFYRNGTKIGTAPVQNSSVTPGVGVATLAASNWNTATYSVELRLRQTAVFFGGTPALSETGEIVSSDTDAVTVANSTGPNTTGGGWVEDLQSTNRKTNFGVTIKFNKGFTNLQGNAVAVFRSTDPAAVSAANPTGAVSIRIKTNNLIGMGLKPNTTNTVLLTAKANAEVADAVTGAVLSTISGGNITNFTMTVSDTPDQFGFVFRRSDGTVYKLIGSLDASGNVMPVNLGGGQTTVRTN